MCSEPFPLVNGPLVRDEMDKLTRLRCPVMAKQAKVRVRLAGLLISAAALAATTFSTAGQVFAFAGSSRSGCAISSLVASTPSDQFHQRGDVSAQLWLDKSLRDRDRFRKRYKEYHTTHKLENRTSHKPISWDMLPSVEDVSLREFTGDAKVDPIGGRKKYSFLVMFKFLTALSAQSVNQDLKKAIDDYILFFTKKMSGRDVSATLRRDPKDRESSIVQLEYPMPEYGASTRGKVRRKQHDKATLVEFDVKLPPAAINYIRKKIYNDNRILRWTCLRHTTRFFHAGEDNELAL